MSEPETPLHPSAHIQWRNHRADTTGAFVTCESGAGEMRWTFKRCSCGVAFDVKPYTGKLQARELPHRRSAP
jgi:hypothetical protein